MPTMGVQQFEQARSIQVKDSSTGVFFFSKVPSSVLSTQNHLCEKWRRSPSFCAHLNREYAQDQSHQTREKLVSATFLLESESHQKGDFFPLFLRIRMRGENRTVHNNTLLDFSHNFRTTACTPKHPKRLNPLITTTKNEYDAFTNIFHSLHHKGRWISKAWICILVSNSNITKWRFVAAAPFDDIRSWVGSWFRKWNHWSSTNPDIRFILGRHDEFIKSRITS